MSRQRRPEDEERRQSAGSALLGFGVLLLMPPFLNLFTKRTTVFGLPTEVVYLFVIWLSLVLGAAWLSRATAPRPEETAKDDPLAFASEEAGLDGSASALPAKPPASLATGPGLGLGLGPHRLDPAADPAHRAPPAVGGEDIQGAPR